MSLVKIKKFERGYGIGFLGRKKVLVKGVDIDDEISIDVKQLKKKKKFFIAENYEFLKKSNNHIQPLCKYFYQCGGCNFQHLTYERELEIKYKEVFNLFGRAEEIIKGTRFFYRNRADFIVRNKKLGFRKAFDFSSFIPTNECVIVHKKLNEAKQVIEKILSRYDIAEYDLITHEGNLRYVVLRTNGESVQINVVVKKIDEEIMNFVNDLKNSFNPHDSIWISENDSLADVSYGSLKEHFLEKYLLMHYNDLKFFLTPNAFFQTNLLLYPKMFDHILDLISNLSFNVILDLFSGIGVFSQIIAKRFNGIKAIGVDINKENIDLAILSAEYNNLKNVKYIVKDARTFANEFNDEIDLLIVDPPREGLHKNVIKMIKKIKPKHIIYVSCNIKTQIRDLLSIQDEYEVLSVQPIDMFPNTWHLENVVLLKLK